MTSDEDQDIARRTASSSLYSISGSIITIALGFVRITLLLRILFPDEVGLSALAWLYVSLVFMLFNFGFDSAFIHRPEVDETVRRTYFSLRLGSGLSAGLTTVVLIPILSRIFSEYSLLALVMLAYTGIFVLKSFTLPQETILNKRMAFRQISTMNVVSSILMTITAPSLAWLGWGVWSLVAEQFVGIFSRAFMLVFIYHPWPIRFGWDREVVSWFWDFGKKIWHSSNLTFLLDRFDDWYTTTFLGLNAAGFYTKAYEYANYPRRVVAKPLLSVFYPAFARLQNDRLRLSRAFFRTTSLVVRASAFFSLVLILTAPEFILILVGEKWAPMTTTFQLMIIYTFLDPLSIAANNLLISTGHPHFVLRARIMQVIIFVPAVFILGTLFNINGVALAADLMILAGTLFLFRKTKKIVDYSQRSLWLWPLLAMVATAVLVLSLNPIWSQLNLWGTLVSKIGLITAVYGSLLWLTERDQLRSGWKMIWGIIVPMLNQRKKYV